MFTPQTKQDAESIQTFAFLADGAYFDVPYADEEPYFDEEKEYEKAMDYRNWLLTCNEPAWAQ
jgi:hypothetical protein